MLGSKASGQQGLNLLNFSVSTTDVFDTMHIIYTSAECWTEQTKSFPSKFLKEWRWKLMGIINGTSLNMESFIGVKK